MIKAPEDASRCVQIPNLKDNMKDSHIVKNPKKTYFEQSNAYYKAKYPDGDNMKTIKVESFLLTKDNKNYLLNKSMEIIQTQQGNMPIVKTYEKNAYDSAYFVKALKFYDYRKQSVGSREPITNCEQFKVDDGIIDVDYRTYDISTLHYQNQVIFFERHEKWLQLRSYDVVSKYLQPPKDDNPAAHWLNEYLIEIPQDGEKWYHYHPIFSKPFGLKKEHTYEKIGKKSLQEFINEQFVFCVRYLVEGNQKYIFDGLYMFCLKNPKQPIEINLKQHEYRKFPIQYVTHMEDKE